MKIMLLKEVEIKKKVSFDKILNRIKKLGQPYHFNVNYTGLVMKIIDQIYNNIETEKIDEVMGEQCASMSSQHYDYYNLASHLVISNHQKKTEKYNLLDYISLIYNQEKQNYISDNFYKLIKDNHTIYEQFIDKSRDYLIDYFGFKTLERAYLIKYDDNIIENIQYMWLRVAIQIHEDNFNMVKQTYDCLSKKEFIHATPTLFNSGTKRPQLSSCFLLGMQEDSIKGIFDTLGDCASISKWAGGIGLHVHNIRSEGTHIKGTNGISNGLVPMLRVFNNTARYVDQGGNKRKGSFAMYLEPWHGDIEKFLDLKKNHGDEEGRARDLFYALWIPDYFMECVEKNENWYLMSPDQCPGLYDTYGDDFKKIYIKYVQDKRYLKEIKSRDLWFKILDSQMETGTPYMLYKDACNKKSNQQNLGTIKSSNLCAEIVEFSNENESAVCNLGSISLPSCLEYNNETKKYDFNFDKLKKISNILTFNLNTIIDKNYYPTDKTYRSNINHRPIGVGVQGLADVFALMKYGFDSDEAKQLNKDIFETIYYGSLCKSNQISKERQKKILFLRNILLKDIQENRSDFLSWLIPLLKNNYYNESFYYNLTNNTSTDDIRYINSDYHNLKPTFEEILGKYFYSHYLDHIKKQEDYFNYDYNKYNNVNSDLFKLFRTSELCGSYSSFEDSPLSKGLFQFNLWNIEPSNRFNWNSLRNSIKKYGVRNSLCVALMPTASTSQILGNNECFEPFTSNIYMRRTLAGEFVVINKYLIKDLIELNLWNNELKNEIIRNKGSIQSIDTIPENIKSIYKITWEIDPKYLIDMAKDRGAYVCQSQSMNLWIEDPNYKNLTKTHFYAWKQGLKTGIYYLRRKAKHQAQQFTVEPVKNNKQEYKEQEETECLMCSG